MQNNKTLPVMSDSNDGAVRDLVISQRMYMLTRSITGIMDSAVEIVTNSYDAYRKKELRYGLSGVPKPIWVTVNYQDRTLVVVDNALGMTGQELITKMGTVGSYSSQAGVRGYFSRGAKDIISIGDITYKCIVGSSYSCVHLTSLSKFIIRDVDKPLADGVRDELGIPSGNGTWVHVKLLPHIKIPDFDRMRFVASYYSMRDIFSDPSVDVRMTVISKDGSQQFGGGLSYTYPALKNPESPLVDVGFVIEGWGDDSACVLQLWELETPGNRTLSSTYRGYGVLVCTDNAIHANEHFSSEVETHPKFNHVRGRLTCPFLDQLMWELEDPVVQDPRNISPVINADRSGLNKRHPFVIDLYRHVSRMIRHVLNQELKRELHDEDLLIDIQDLLTSLDLTPDDFLATDATSSHVPIPDVTKYLHRRRHVVTHENDKAQYQFQDIKPPEPPKPDEPDTNEDERLNDVETGNGNYSHTSTKMQIRIVDGELFERCFNYAFVHNILIVDVSLKDPFIAKSTTPAAAVRGSYDVVDVPVFFQACVTYASLSVAQVILKRRLENMSENEVKLMSRSDVENLEYQLHFNIMPKMHELLSNSTVFDDIVSNNHGAMTFQ